MLPTEEQAERIARCLDGDDIALDAAERVVAEAIRHDEAALGRMLDDIPMPAEAMARASRQLAAARPGRLAARWGYLAATAAMAAAVVAAVVLWNSPVRPGGGPAQVAGNPGEIPAEVLFAADTGPAASELDLASGDLEQLEVDVMNVAPQAGIEADIAALENDLDCFWTDTTADPIDIEPAGERTSHMAVCEVKLC